MHLGPPPAGSVSAVLGAGAVLVLTACSVVGGSGSAGAASVAPPEPAPSAAVQVGEPATPEPSPERAADTVLRSRVTRVAGNLSDVRRDRVEARAHATVQRYLDEAFGRRGGVPRGFVPGLRREAGADREVLAAVGDVEVTRARAWFAVSAPHGRPVGVTARVAVDLAGPGGDAGGDATEALTGRLLLTRAVGGWRVFGYDLARAGADHGASREARR